MQEQGCFLDPETMSALLSVLKLVSWESICKCVRAMALDMAHIVSCDYGTVFEGFSAMVVFQGTLASLQLARLSHCSCRAECLRVP